MATFSKQYRCIAPELHIRSQPGLDSSYKTGKVFKRHEIINVDEKSRVDVQGFSWLQHDRGWSAERSLNGRDVFMSDAIAPREQILGLNIDPNNPKGNPLPADRLLGVGWVRFALHIDSRRETPEQAFSFYDPIIRAYKQMGTRVILILLQDTFLGNMPWANGDWVTYARNFAERAGVVARRYRGQVAAYQIWNEGDMSGATTSHYVAPANYAPLLLAASQAITQADPTAKVITGGLATGAGKAADYMRDVRTALNGVFPADGIAVHPYGQTPPGAEPFPKWSTGALDDYLAIFSANFPQIPLWITEIGVPRVDTNDQALWPGIANYMNATVDFVRTHYPHIVQSIVWFAWSDSMDRAGIVTSEQQPKNQIFSTYFKKLHADYPTARRIPATPFDGELVFAQIGTDGLPDNTVGELAARIASPVQTALLVRTSSGTSWQGRNETRRDMAINGPADLTKWAAELARGRIGLHAWHEIQAGTAAEIATLTQVGRAPGVLSLVLDLNPSTSGLKAPSEIRAFMISVRRALPEPFHIGLSFEGRPEAFAAVKIEEWLPYVNSWFPKVLHVNFGGASQGPIVFLNTVLEALKPFRKPIIPMLQAGAYSGTVVSQDHLRQGARLATNTFNVSSLAFWHLGALQPTDIDAIKGINLPWLASYNLIPTMGTMTTRTTTTLRVRATPAADGFVLDQLQPGEKVTILEKRMVGLTEWVRHSRGWSMVRNATTGEVYLA